MTETLKHQLIGFALLPLAMTFVIGQTTENFTPQVRASLVFHTVVVSFASFLAWIRLLRRYMAARLSVFVFFAPLFGTPMGAWLLNKKSSSVFVGRYSSGGRCLSGGGWWGVACSADEPDHNKRLWQVVTNQCTKSLAISGRSLRVMIM